MRGFDDFDPLAGHGVVVAGDDQALQRAVPVRLNRLGHRGRSLARADHDGAPLGRRRQEAGQHPGGVGGGEGCLEEVEKDSPGFGHFGPDTGKQ